jgi:hypothetical protein
MNGTMTADELVAFAERLSRIAAAGEGISALAACLERTIGVPVAIDDARGRRLAGPTAIAEAWRLPIGDERTVFGTLIVGGENVGHRAAAAVRLAAAVIAPELARLRDGASREQTVWERLLEGAYPDADAARDDARLQGIAPAPQYLAIVLEYEPEGAPGSDGRSPVRSLALESFRNAAGDLGIVERGASLTVLVPISRDADAARARTAAQLFARSVARRRLSGLVHGGMGTVEPLASVRRSAEHARVALAIGRRLFGPGRISLYDELGAYPLLLRGADAPALRAFAARVLAPLRDYDRRHQTELERTLRLYFEVGENVKTAAERLSVHRHTVFYRLRQIAELTSRRLENPHDQLTLRMAVAIDALGDL